MDRIKKEVTFATTCWEKDWRLILLDPDYLRVKQIENHRFPFSERVLIINNVKDLETVKRAAQKRIDEGVLTGYFVAEERAEEILSFFQLKRENFKPGPDAGQYQDVNSDWIYYNALGPLSAIYFCRSDYLLYLTGDVRMDRPVDWIGKAVQKMEENPKCKVANPVWNDQYREARRESYRWGWNFYTAKEGFSDQLFLVKQDDFRQPIYEEIRDDSSHFPRGDVFEKRVFSYMKNRGWERIIFRRGSYTHENI